MPLSLRSGIQRWGWETTRSSPRSSSVSLFLFLFVGRLYDTISTGQRSSLSPCSWRGADWSVVDGCDCHHSFCFGRLPPSPLSLRPIGPPSHRAGGEVPVGRWVVAGTAMALFGFSGAFLAPRPRYCPRCSSACPLTVLVARRRLRRGGRLGLPTSFLAFDCLCGFTRELLRSWSARFPCHASRSALNFATRPETRSHDLSVGVCVPVAWT